MNRLATIFAWAAIGVVLLVSLAAAAMSSGRLVAPNRRVKKSLERIKQLEEERPEGQPVAETPEMSFDFGVLNPNDTKSYMFVIRNAGERPLALQKGPTSCKCTLADIQNKTLFPARQTEIRVEWNTGHSDAEFRQSATILTNDPQRPEIVFEVHGKVRLACFANPPSLRFPDILPGRTETAETIIGSHLWEDFEISSVESSLPGLTWKLEPLSPGERGAAGLKSGYRLVTTSPPDFADTWLNGSLKVTATGPSGQETIELDVGGKLRSRIAVYGEQIDETGLIDLGLLPLGAGAKVSLMLRIRDEEPAASVREIRVRPEFVKAEVTPYLDSTGAAKPGLYHFEILIPADAPECNHFGVHRGQAVVEFDHPRAKNIAVKLNFAVKDKLPD